jgi:hypothetical protein
MVNRSFAVRSATFLSATAMTTVAALASIPARA